MESLDELSEKIFEEVKLSYRKVYYDKFINDLFVKWPEDILKDLVCKE